MATDGGQTANYELTISFRYQLRIIYGRYTVDTRLINGTLVYTHRMNITVSCALRSSMNH